MARIKIFQKYLAGVASGLSTDLQTKRLLV